MTAGKAICQELGPAFTRPTFITFLHLATGWVLCRSKPTVTSLVCTIGGSLLGHVAKHWTVYERFFSRARWSPGDLSDLLRRRVVAPLIDGHGAEGSGGAVELVFDGTTCGRTGRQVAARGRNGWRTVSVRKGGRLFTRRVLSRICLWYHVRGDEPIKVLIVRYPKGREDDDFFFCTDPEVSEERIIERYDRRWSIEEAIRDGKQHGGFELVQGWCPRTVTRQAPIALVVQTIVKAWYIIDL